MSYPGISFRCPRSIVVFAIFESSPSAVVCISSFLSRQDLCEKTKRGYMSLFCPKVCRSSPQQMGKNQASTFSPHEMAKKKEQKILVIEPPKSQVPIFRQKLLQFVRAVTRQIVFFFICENPNYAKMVGHRGNVQ